MRVLLGLTLSLSLAACSPSNEEMWDSFRKASKAGDIERSIEVIKPMAEAGDLQAKYAIGVGYGLIEPPNLEEQRKWLLSAAKGGYRPAMKDLASSYFSGSGGNEDFVQAARWAKKYFEASSTFDSVDGATLYRLGVQYLEGKGVPQNYIKAHTLFNIAGSVLEPLRADTAKSLGWLERRMTPEQIAQAQADASRCTRLPVVCPALR